MESVRQLATWLADSDIDMLELSGPGLLLRVRRDGATEAIDLERALARPKATAQPRERTVNASSLGIFLTAHPLQATALAPPGARVRAGEPIALLQIGSLLVPVCAPRDATVGSVRVAPGTLVGFGTPLFELDPP